MMKSSRLTNGAAVLAAGLWLVGAAAPSAHAEEARQTYDKLCVSCHGPAGKGDGPASKMLKPPPSDLSATAKTASEADLTKIIKEGGKAVGRSPAMPAYGAKLDTDQVNGLVQLLKGFSGK